MSLFMQLRTIKMINKVIALVGLLFISISVEAAIVSRTYTYTDGNTISANENNTNENTLYTEFNGNIEAANIKDGTITNADIADTQIVVGKFASVVQSTFTWVYSFGTYRRPTLQYVSVTTVDVSSNTGVDYKTCIQFPDEVRCVTENTGSTSVNRRFIITESASMSGTKNSGLRSGYIETANTWYSFYAAKTTDVTTDFVIVADTITPTSSANFALLNTVYGTNGWVYLGTIPNGDNSGATADIPAFTMSANRVSFYNNLTGVANNTKGVRLATTAGASTLTWTWTAGFTLSSGQLPPQLVIGDVAVENGSGGGININDAAATISHILLTGFTGNVILQIPNMSLFKGLRNAPGASIAQAISLSSYIDNILGVGYNPQM